MKIRELTVDTYCCADFCEQINLCKEDPNPEGCWYCHRKWPTPAEFAREYGVDTAGHAVWYWNNAHNEWGIAKYESLMEYRRNLKLDKGGIMEFFKPCYVACTPYGKPPAEWRPAV